MPKISTFLSYQKDAEKAVDFYCSIFPGSKVVRTLRCGDAGPGPKGSILLIEFELLGNLYLAMNGGPSFNFTEGVSLSVLCETQEEVDKYWKALSQGGQEIACGWLKDKFGVFWQITPRGLIDAQHDPDPAASARVMKAMMGMVKIDLAAIERARRGR